jgi:ABC-type antimicrobial peptide transport system permease subunit
MVVCGIGIGLPVVWALGRLVQSQLYDVKPFAPGVIAIAMLALCAAGLCAAFVPARRASAVNPTDALRVE